MLLAIIAIHSRWPPLVRYLGNLVVPGLSVGHILTTLLGKVDAKKSLVTSRELLGKETKQKSLTYDLSTFTISTQTGTQLHFDGAVLMKSFSSLILNHCASTDADAGYLSALPVLQPRDLVISATTSSSVTAKANLGGQHRCRMVATFKCPRCPHV